MALLKQSIQVSGKLDELFTKLLEGQAPEKFTRGFLRDLGFKSSNWLAAISLLKGLGFLSDDGSPTPQYMEFLDRTKWKKTLAKAVKEAYSDIFIMKREPTSSDLEVIAGKYKSTYNMSDIASNRAARTFLALLELSDQEVIRGEETKTNDRTKEESEDPADHEKELDQEPPLDPNAAIPQQIGLNYNIQIHLPATKDIEVYNAIFKSLREHIID